MKKVMPKGKKVKLVDPSHEEFRLRVPADNKAVIGISKGVTLKIGDFEFVRLDVYGLKNVEDNEEDMREGLKKLSEIIDEQLQEEIDNVE